MNERRKAAVYIRVGNPDQLSGDRQCDEIVAKFGDTHEIVGEYRDTASSTLGVSDRPALKKLLQEAAKGEFDVLLCTDFTRLTRHVTPEIVAALKNSGVRIVTKDGNEVGITDLVVANATKTFVEHQSERIKRGIRAARERRKAAADAAGAGSGSE